METVPYSVIHGDDTNSEEVRPPTPNLPWSLSPIPLRSEWVNFIGLACRWTAHKIVLPPKKRALSSPDLEPLPKKHCPSSRREIEKSSYLLQGVLDLADSALGRLHGRVNMGVTRLAAVEHEVIAAEQRNERAD
ncbi:hypothetical protein L1987_53050 [Smallanthus sonchifolius]|uniref:Uncharacterized protein n=1 Tax=Smallanthus sonchifolius TaxID=185202 RepID=A0ACB9EVF1_9ASTR|nr:hypothetical protein L1987_53050 [Smallanthus sonchifolius]